MKCYRSGHTRVTRRSSPNKSVRKVKTYTGGTAKHIQRRRFFVRECVENMQITVPYVNTVDNLADFFTKPLEGKHFFRMRDAIMNVPLELGGQDAFVQQKT